MKNRDEIIRILNRRINEFDICPLLKILEILDVPLKNLLFKGNNTCSSTTTLCKEIQLSPNGDTILTLNFGLLMGSSPLPNYYRKSIDKGDIDEEKFVSFLQFFNHFLIKDLIRMSWIEKFMFENWEAMHIQHINMLGLNSVCSMHWLVSLFFPDLKVQVDKSVKRLKFDASDFQLGKSVLGGKSALGGFIKNFASAYSITLKAESEQTDTHVFWPAEIRKRFRENVFPLIKKTCIYLIVYLTIDQYNRASYLSSQCHLGYASLGDAKREFKWLLYEG